MLRFVAVRFGQAILVLFVVSVVAFALLHLAPGDPASVLAGPNASTETIEAIRHRLGLDQGLVGQYLGWMGDIVHGNLGQSYTTQQPITSLISQRMGSTLQLTVAASVLMVLLGVGAGIALVNRRWRSLRSAAETLTTASLAMPPFVSGIILIFLFAVLWRLLPSGGSTSLFVAPSDALARLVMPSIAMAIPGAAVLARLLATEMRRAREQEYVQTAIAKGASPRRITWRHVVPNSLAPAVIELGLRVGHLLGGAVVAEAIFARPGLGSLLVQSVADRDYTLAQVLLLLGVTVAILAQLAAELSIGFIDPRVRAGGAAA
jgi:peptide/nickel transport system permease protein